MSSAPRFGAVAGVAGRQVGRGPRCSHPSSGAASRGRRSWERGACPSTGPTWRRMGVRPACVSHSWWVRTLYREGAWSTACACVRQSGPSVVAGSGQARRDRAFVRAMGWQSWALCALGANWAVFSNFSPGSRVGGRWGTGAAETKCGLTSQPMRRGHMRGGRAGNETGGGV